MDKSTLRGDWNIIKGKIKEHWGKLTDNDLTEINGKREQLLGLLQKRYGYAKEKAEIEIKDWEKRVESYMKENTADRENKKYAGAAARDQTGQMKENQQHNQQNWNAQGNQSKKDWNENQDKTKRY